MWAKVFWLSQLLRVRAGRGRRCGPTPGQQPDGGFGAWGKRSLWRFGNETPGAVAGTLNDASVADVTGRILECLLAARASGALSSTLAQSVDDATARAVEHLTVSRADSAASPAQGQRRSLHKIEPIGVTVLKHSSG